MADLTIGEQLLAGSMAMGSPVAVERAYLERELNNLRSLESRARGLYAECLVAALLGPPAHGSSFRAASWDLCWKDRTIGIRATGRYNNATVVPEDGSALAESKLSWRFEPRSTFTPSEKLSAKKRRVWTDVLVLAIHRGRSIDADWTFLVLDGRTLDDKKVTSLSLKRATELATPKRELEPEELQRAVERVGRRRPVGGLYPARCDSDDPIHQAASKPLPSSGLLA